MQGTQHERVSIITLSYLIGFISAFILFGVNFSGDVKSDKQHYVSHAQNTATVVIPTQNKSSHLVSPDGTFVFSCEEKSNQKSSYCTAEIYDLRSADKASVLIDGKSVTMSRDLMNVVGWTNQGLTIGTVKSVNSETPWILSDKD